MFWKKKIPDFILDIEYENLVNNKEDEIKKMLDFCDLSWDEKCLNHEKNSKTPANKSIGVILFHKLVKSIKNNIVNNTRTGSQKIMVEAGTFSPAYFTVIQRIEENISAPSIYAWK